jgi:hypothetical protein
MARLAETPTLSSGTCEASALAMLVDRIANPVDSRIISDLGVGWVHKDNLIVLHRSILIDPIGVENTKVSKFTSNLFFGNTLQVSLEFELVHTLVLGFSVHHTTVNLTLATSTAHSTANYNVSLFGFVAETMGLVGSCRDIHAGNLGALTVLPGSHTEQKSENIRLLVAPKLFHILVSSHDEVSICGVL